MTLVATIVGLVAIMWGAGTGSVVVSRVAAPMVGGMVSALLLTLLGTAGGALSDAAIQAHDRLI